MLYHSIDFTNNDGTTKNTWDDWHLIPSSRPTVAMPTYSQKYVDIPGRDGALDLTDYLVGEPTYSDRTGSFEFYVQNDYSGNNTWATRRNAIASFLNGSKITMKLIDDDPNYVYRGRAYLKEWRSEAQFSKVVIEYRLEPYKRNTSDGTKAGL